MMVNQYQKLKIINLKRKDSLTFTINNEYTADIMVFDKDFMSNDDMIAQTTISIIDA